MDLKKFLPKKTTEDSYEYFWSLVVEPGWVQAGIWRLGADSAQVMNTSSSYPWELDEELVNAVDSALSSAISTFPKDIDEPSKTVFGVIPSWVVEGQIKEEYLEKIKKICSDLSLTPIGFVVVSESITHLLKSEEKSPVNAIYIGVYKNDLEVSVFKLGNLMGSTQVTRSLSLVDDVKEGISRFVKDDALPSRMVLYGGKESELSEVESQLSSVNWDGDPKLQFLHTPKIEILSLSRKIDAISLAGASEVSNVTNLISKTSVDQTEDVSLSVDPHDHTVENVAEVDPEDLGFVDGEIEVSTFASEQAENDFAVKSDTQIENQNSSQETINKPRFGKLSFPKKISVPKPVLLGLIVLLVVFVSSFVAWWYLPKAIVTVYISPRMLDERIEITVTADGSSDTAEKILRGQTVSTTVTGEKTSPTTGIKTIGDKAKGEVTLYRVGSALNLKSGTVLTGPQKLKFVLDEDIEVASGSASSPSTTTASVIAEAIGADYNVAADTSFTVGTYSSSDIEAKNAESFTGGSSQEISAVSADDQKRIEDDLVTELKERAKEELLTTLSDTEIFIDESIVIKNTTKKFSHKVGDEATSIKLNLELDTEAVTVNRTELFSLAEASVREKIPSGFVLREDQIDPTFTFKKKDGNTYTFEVLVSANLLPEVQTDGIASKIQGKYPTVAQEYLIKEIPGFARAEILLMPKLPGKLGTLPHVSGNIEVEVAAER